MVFADDPGDAAALAHEAQPLRQSLVRYFARRLRNTSDVEDLVQDVFTRIAARDSEAPIGHLGKYVHQTAASVLADYARRRSARRAESHIAFNPDLHAESDFDAERILVAREDVEMAMCALLELPERTRTIFILRRLEKVPTRDVAEQLGISVSTVEKNMIRAALHLGSAMGARR